jgi:hypothetical protein
MEKILIFLACFYCFNIVAKPSFDTLSVSHNSKLLRLESKKQSIYIFCPINSFTKEIYLEKFDKLFKKSKIQAIDSLDFKLIFYKRSTNKSKGLNIYFSNIDSLLLVNEFEVYFQNFEKEKIYKFYCEFLPKKSVYSKYIKGTKTKVNEDLLQYISKYYECSFREAEEYITLLKKITICVKNN